MKESNSFPFLGLLFLVFLTLKLTNVINWSWWYVTMPLWIGFAFVGLMLLFLFIKELFD